MNEWTTVVSINWSDPQHLSRDHLYWAILKLAYGAGYLSFAVRLYRSGSCLAIILRCGAKRQCFAGFGQEAVHDQNTSTSTLKLGKGSLADIIKKDANDGTIRRGYNFRQRCRHHKQLQRKIIFIYGFYIWEFHGNYRPALRRIKVLLVLLIKAGRRMSLADVL